MSIPNSRTYRTIAPSEGASYDTDVGKFCEVLSSYYPDAVTAAGGNPKQLLWMSLKDGGTSGMSSEQISRLSKSVATVHESCRAESNDSDFPLKVRFARKTYGKEMTEKNVDKITDRFCALPSVLSEALTKAPNRGVPFGHQGDSRQMQGSSWMGSGSFRGQTAQESIQKFLEALKKSKQENPFVIVRLMLKCFESLRTGPASQQSVFERSKGMEHGENEKAEQEFTSHHKSEL